MYIPPAKLAAMLKDVNDPNTKEYQRMTWEALKKSINGLINKINTSNIKNLVPELFGENLIRGRGLFARSSMKAQAAAPIFTSVYAAMIAVINTKIPANGELVLVRLIVTSCSLLCFALLLLKIKYAIASTDPIPESLPTQRQGRLPVVVDFFGPSRQPACCPRDCRAPDPYTHARAVKQCSFLVADMFFFFYFLKKKNFIQTNR